jgi:hypothetical protein
LHEYGRYFNPHLKGYFLFGDITKTPNEPGLVKSRPINNKNINSIILKWRKGNKIIKTSTQQKLK